MRRLKLEALYPRVFDDQTEMRQASGRKKKSMLDVRLRTYFLTVFATEKLTFTKTINAYKKAIDDLERFTNKPLKIGQIRFEKVDAWLHHRIANGTSERTAYRDRKRVLDVAFRAAPELRRMLASRPQRGTLLFFFEDRYIPDRMIGCKLTSIHHVEMSLRRFDAFLGRSATFDDLTDEKAAKFVRHLLDVGKLKRPTVNTKLGDLKSVWNYAWRLHEVLEQPRIGSLPEYRDLPIAWTIPELTQIVGACQALNGTFRHWKAADWWTAFVLFTYDTGLRISAAHRVKLQAVNFTTGSVDVEAQFQKHRVAQSYQLSKQCLTVLGALRAPQRLYLFGNERGTRSVRFYPKWREILQSVALPTGRKRGMHCLRRTSATHIAAAAGIDAASKHMGHSSVELTERYIDPRICPEHDATALLPRPQLTDFTRAEESHAIEVIGGAT